MARSFSSERHRPVLGIVVIVAVVLLVAGAVIIPGELSRIVADLGVLVAMVLFALIAGLLVSRRPGHPVSWLLALAAVLGAISAVSAELLPHGVARWTGWHTMLAIISGPSWIALLVTTLVLIPLLFPTGSPPSPSWRWVAWASAALLAVMSGLLIVQESFCVEGKEDDVCRRFVDNPIGIAGITNPEESVSGDVLFTSLLVCVVAALLSLIVRYRRSSSVERQQIKWILLSVGLFVTITILVEDVWVDAMGRSEPAGYAVVSQLLWVMIPASVAVAILRYRLYDIDRIISRTVGYALVLALLGAVALGSIALLTLFLPSDDPLVVAVATLSAAALFNPVRRRVQSLVDRRFNRTRFVTERVIDQFTGTLRNRVDAEDVVADWLGVVSETMQPSTVGVWTRAETMVPRNGSGTPVFYKRPHEEVV